MVRGNSNLPPHPVGHELGRRWFRVGSAHRLGFFEKRAKSSSGVSSVSVNADHAACCSGVISFISSVSEVASSLITSAGSTPFCRRLASFSARRRHHVAQYIMLGRPSNSAPQISHIFFTEILHPCVYFAVVRKWLGARSRGETSRKLKPPPQTLWPRASTPLTRQPPHNRPGPFGPRSRA